MFEPTSIIVNLLLSFIFFLRIKFIIDFTTLPWKDPNKKIDKSIPSDMSKYDFIDFLLTKLSFFILKKIKI